MRLITCLLLILTSLNASALEKSCAPEDNAWLPARYYDKGAIVFYDDQWYAAQEWQEGARPDGGGFAWKPLDKGPDCISQASKNGNTAAQGVPANGNNDSNTSDTGAMMSDADCKPAPTWTFSEAYSVGQWVSHEGQVFKAIRPSNGDMPGVAEPPHWAPVKANCPATN